MVFMKNLFFSLLLLTTFSCVKKQANKKQVLEDISQEQQLAGSPPMGWNSWNYYGKHQINENLIIRIIDSISASGLQDAGYEYIVIDGGWRDTKLGANGELLPHPIKFPNGIKRLANYAHSKGLKFGLHTVPGTADCINDPVGGYGKEEIHIQQFVDWGIDFIKLDKCKFKGGWNEDLLKDTYFKWHKLLKEKSNSIVLSISAYRWREWYPEVSQMARTTGDISARVAGMSGTDAVFDGTIKESESTWKLLTVMEVAKINDKSAQFAGNGFWNDPDMLVTGEHGLTYTEQQSHFALWCIMSSPLMLGNNPLNMSKDEKSIILNEEAITINQDPTEQGKRIRQENDTEVWAKKLKDGKVAVLLLNRNQKAEKNISLHLNDIGLSQNVSVKDVYNKKELGTAKDVLAFDIPPKSCLFLLLTQ